MKGKDYEKQLQKLLVALVRLQQRVMGSCSEAQTRRVNILTHLPGRVPYKYVDAAY